MAITTLASPTGYQTSPYTLGSPDAGAGANRALIVYLTHIGSILATPTAVTYGGVAMTLSIVSTGGGTGVNCRRVLATLLNPPSGVNALVVTFTGSGRFRALVDTRTGVSAINNVTMPATHAVSALPKVTVTSAAGSTVVAYGDWSVGDRLTEDAGVTELFDGDVGAEAGSNAALWAGQKAGEASTVVGGTLPVTDGWVVAGLSLAPVAVAPVITGPSGAAGAATSSKSIPENTTAVHTFTATPVSTWSKNGGANQALFSLNASTGALAYITAPNFEADPGPHVVVVRATAGGLTSDQTVTVTVTNANEAPTFSGPNIGARSGSVGVALTPLDVSGRFADPDAGDTRTFAAVGTWPAGVTVTSAGVIQGTPTTAGSYPSLTVRATDAGSLQVSSDTFTFTVAGPGTLTTHPLHNDTTGALLASTAGCTLTIFSKTTRALVHRAVGLTTNAQGELSVAHATIGAGVEYAYDVETPQGSRLKLKAAT